MRLSILFAFVFRFCDIVMSQNPYPFEEGEFFHSIPLEDLYHLEKIVPKNKLTLYNLLEYENHIKDAFVFYDSTVFINDTIIIYKNNSEWEYFSAPWLEDVEDGRLIEVNFNKTNDYITINATIQTDSTTHSFKDFTERSNINWNSCGIDGYNVIPKEIELWKDSLFKSLSIAVKEYYYSSNFDYPLFDEEIDLKTNYLDPRNNLIFEVFESGKDPAPYPLSYYHGVCYQGCADPDLDWADDEFFNYYWQKSVLKLKEEYFIFKHVTSIGNYTNGAGIGEYHDINGIIEKENFAWSNDVFGPFPVVECPGDYWEIEGYKNSLPNGKYREWIWYDSDNDNCEHILTCKGNYTDGFKSGIWEYYDINGKIMEKEKYENGVLIKE